MSIPSWLWPNGSLYDRAALTRMGPKTRAALTAGLTSLTPPDLAPKVSLTEFMARTKAIDSHIDALVRATNPARPTWDEYGLAGAQWAATRADCTRRQVGALIMDAEHRVIATGYNGYPAGQGGCASTSACPRGRFTHAEIAQDSAYVGVVHPCQAIHAEENAILYARRDLRGCTMYVTDSPCPNCLRLLAGTGVSQVIYPTGSHTF